MKTSYCAFLRGVNVNGRTMKMADVCTLFKEQGLDNVSSVLATGNILFTAEAPPKTLRPMLEAALAAQVGTEVYLFLKTAGEVAGILANVPFTVSPGRHIYAFISEAGFESTLMEAFEKITPCPGEAAAVKGGVFYWQVQKGATLDAGFSKASLGNKALQSKFTSRNLNTIAKVAAKLGAMAL